ncbi:methyl-accepting chemotaxis protein [Paenibacillus baekrokdamisoli]|nr:methyl-accepting chemotaxis protein [Paenibacillus baekrokdamisoli]MBB3070175.1 methyl-accepting chemotaxis protein [Paenibacillus baekrokdamisoli]
MLKKKRSLTLRTKLILLIAFPITLYLGSTFYWMFVYDSAINTMSKSLFLTTNQVNTLVLNADRDLYQSLTAFQSLKDKSLDEQTKKKLKAEMSDNAKQATDRIEQAVAIVKANGLQQLSKKDDNQTILMIVDKFHETFPQWLALANKSITDGSPIFYDPKLNAEFENARGGINVIGEILDEHANNEVERIKKEASTFQESSLFGVAGCSLLMVIIGYFIIRNLSRAAKYVLQLTNSVSQGDLREQPFRKHGNDEFGMISQALETMIKNLRNLIVTISEHAQQVSGASEQMNTTSQQSAISAAQVSEEINQVNECMEIQSRAAEETARAIEEMAVGIGRIAENTSSISDSSLRTSHDSEHGQTQLDQLSTQLAGIRNMMGQLSGIVNQLHERSNEIGSIAANITNFSNQTNILSLNASIEAARAGEHGRGFAVVAAEIRKLATQSLESADVINQLVISTRNDMSDASNVMAATLGEVAQGGEMMTQVNESFTQIRQSIQNIAGQIHDNSAITEQMSASSEEVSATMEQSADTAKKSLINTQSVAGATKEQLILMEDIAKSAEHLHTIVEGLDKSVATFKI